jgi:RNA-splicing ligase RtcB
VRNKCWNHNTRIREVAMAEELKTLIEIAKRVTPTPEHREEQRRSFAYGNTAFENARITREMVDQQAEKLADENAKRTA